MNGVHLGVGAGHLLLKYSSCGMFLIQFRIFILYDYEISDIFISLFNN